MRILGFDIATTTGFALIEFSNYPNFQDGCKLACGIVSSEEINPNLIPHPYPWDWLEKAKAYSETYEQLLVKEQPDHIYVEEVNLGKNRESQRQLYFLHFAFLEAARKAGYVGKVTYLDSSKWRSTIGLRLNKDQKKSNKKLADAKKAATVGGKLDLKKFNSAKKELGVKGKTKWKHLAIEYANKTYGLELIGKDDDIADAICLATAGYILEQTKK